MREGPCRCRCRWRWLSGAGGSAGRARAAGLPPTEPLLIACPGDSRSLLEQPSRALSGHGRPEEPGSPRAFSPPARSAAGPLPHLPGSPLAVGPGACLCGGDVGPVDLPEPPPGECRAVRRRPGSAWGARPDTGFIWRETCGGANLAVLCSAGKTPFP